MTIALHMTPLWMCITWLVFGVKPVRSSFTVIVRAASSETLTVPLTLYGLTA